MADNFLHVELLVDPRDARKFEDAVRSDELTRLFAPFDWHLVLALKGTRPHKYSLTKQFGSRTIRSRDPEDVECLRYVNVWDVPEPLRIAEVMQKLADSGKYDEINQMVVREIQNVVLGVRPPTNGEVEVDDKVVEVYRRFTVRNLGQFLFSSGILIPYLEHNGIANRGVFQSLTGPLNGVSEMWLMKSGPDLLPSGTAQAGGPTFLESVVQTFSGSPPPHVASIAAEVDSLPYAEWFDVMTCYTRTP